MLSVYKILSYIFIPIILINLFVRLINKKEDKKRFKERLAKTKFNLNISKKLIWIHAASIGEFKSCDLIINKYYKDYQILITTTTMSSAKYIERYYYKKVIHQYIPFDVPFWCTKFLNHWKPSLVLWIESDIWPNMLQAIKEKKISCIYLNARISPKSFHRWKSFRNLYSESLRAFNTIYAQSHNDLERIKILSNSKIEYIGNLKLSQNKGVETYKNQKKKFSIMIASSHRFEEEIIIKNIIKLIKNKKLKLCIAPRHPERIKEIINLLLVNNLTYSIDSKGNNLESDVLIIDSFGNLNAYFNKSEIVILGGSFVSKGGHNPLEPAKYNCAIISGKYVYNWQNIYEYMVMEKACTVINKIENLKVTINNYLLNKEKLEYSKMKAMRFSNKKFFDSDILFKNINLVLD